METEGPEPQGKATLAARRQTTRRAFMRNGIVAGLAVAASGGITAGVSYLLQRDDEVGRAILVGRDAVPEPGGEPLRVAEGKFWLVNLAPGEGDPLRTGSPGGLLALRERCTHLHCDVPWRSDLSGASVGFPATDGWFRCPCHGSTFSKAGVRVFGPAPRSLDTFPLTVDQWGNVSVDTSKVTLGGGFSGNSRSADLEDYSDNLRRVVPYAAA